MSCSRNTIQESKQQRYVPQSPETPQDSMTFQCFFFVSTCLFSSPNNRRPSHSASDASVFPNTQKAYICCLCRVPYCSNDNGIVFSQEFIINERKIEIFSKRWIPTNKTKIRAVIIYCHGYSDTCTYAFDGEECSSFNMFLGMLH